MAVSSNVKNNYAETKSAPLLIFKCRLNIKCRPVVTCDHMAIVLTPTTLSGYDCVFTRRCEFLIYERFQLKIPQNPRKKANL